MEQTYYSESQLRKAIMHETVNGVDLHYSLVKKDAKNLSFLLSNQRLLIFNSSQGKLFYINDFTKTPFRRTLPQGKNNIEADMNTVIFRRNESNQLLQFRFLATDEKNEVIKVEWIFTCETNDLAKEWETLINQYKAQKLKATEAKNALSFVHGVIADELSPTLPINKLLNESILKPEEIGPVKQPQESRSRIDLRKSQYNESNLRKSITTPIIAEPVPQPNESMISRLNQSKLIISGAQKGEDPIQFKLISSQIQHKPTLQTNDPRIANSQAQPKKPDQLSAGDAKLINLISKSRQDNTELESIKAPSVVIPNKQQPINLDTDWNYRFLQARNEETILDFQVTAEKALRVILQKDSNQTGDPRRIYQSTGLIVIVCNNFSKEAAQLKRQFRNYHFILQSCKNEIVIGVPLSCLFEIEGSVILVKSQLPSRATEVSLSKEIHAEIKDLERYTRIINTVLERSSLYDLTDIYKLKTSRRLIYVDNLIEYLPSNVDQQYHNSCLRPQFILDSVNQFIPGGDVKSSNRSEYKTLNSLCVNVDKAAKDLGAFLNEKEMPFATALELKDLFHNFGVNFKYLPRVYAEVTGKYTKKYVHTVMVAKVVKYYMIESVIEGKRQTKQVPAQIIVEDGYRVIFEGNNSNSSELWKEIALKFKKVYGMPISMSQIIPGFFLSSVMQLVRANYDLSKLNKAKKIFKQQGIIMPGFVKNLLPKKKSYYRFTTELIDKIRFDCREQKKSQQTYEQIVSSLDLTTGTIPPAYCLNNNHECILEYLSYFVAPPGVDPNAPLQQIMIYGALNQEPPTAFSLRISKNYLQWCNKKDKGDQFKRKIQQTLSIIDYWLDESHIAHCELFELLADHYSMMGNNDECINFMKESLSLCIRSCGAQSRQAGVKYYEMAIRELKAGKKKEALDNFQKARVNMESHQNTVGKYSILLMKLAELYLNNGKIDDCIEHSSKAIRSFDDNEKKSGNKIYEKHKIKAFEILSRAYQISGQKKEFKDMAISCARKFNKTKEPYTFEQMVRICVTAVIFKSTEETCRKFMDVLDKLRKDEVEKLQAAKCIEELMTYADTMVVMEKFMSRFDNLERVLSEMSAKKNMTMTGDTREFLTIVKHVVGCIGEDYIAGLVCQKAYE